MEYIDDSYPENPVCCGLATGCEEPAHGLVKVRGGWRFACDLHREEAEKIGMETIQPVLYHLRGSKAQERKAKKRQRLLNWFRRDVTPKAETGD